MVMSNSIRLVDKDRMELAAENAALLREYADRVERGEIVNLVLVCDNREDYCFERFGMFRDRFHMLGAIEYAKTAVFDAD